jgi:hypothetical protein
VRFPPAPNVIKHSPDQSLLALCYALFTLCVSLEIDNFFAYFFRFFLHCFKPFFWLCKVWTHNPKKSRRSKLLHSASFRSVIFLTHLCRPFLRHSFRQSKDPIKKRYKKLWRPIPGIQRYMPYSPLFRYSQ